MYLYCCPEDGGLLSCTSDRLTCPSCGRRFPISRYDIPLLDVVQAGEAEAFDEQYEHCDTMSDSSIEASKAIAGRFLACAGLESGTRPTVLDVGCGKGELTIGLALHPTLAQATIVGFDHSVKSLEVLARTMRKLSLDESRIHISAQDASALCFQKASFDCVFGNAVLHHFLEWERVVKTCLCLLKPGGCAVFAEPFAAGYVLPMIVFKTAAWISNLKDEELNAPEMGSYDFITNNIGVRVRSHGRVRELSSLTDKHLFTVEDMLRLANEVDVQVDFHEYEAASYYQAFVDDLLKTYGISHDSFASNARQIHAGILDFLGTEYAALFPHFRFVAFRHQTGGRTPGVASTPSDANAAGTADATGGANAPHDPQQIIAKARSRLLGMLSGRGIEIGALHRPCHAPHLNVTYVDRLTRADLLEQYPELKGQPIVETGVIDDAETLQTLPDGSQDFVIANHVIEHMADPIKALLAWSRVLKVGGRLFMAVPDKRHTFDKDRPLTPIVHLVQDFEQPSPERDYEHFREFALHVTCRTFHVRQESEAEQVAQDLWSKQYSIHYHVWDHDAFGAFIDHVRRAFPRWGMTILERTPTRGDEFLLLLERRAV